MIWAARRAPSGCSVKSPVVWGCPTSTQEAAEWGSPKTHGRLRCRRCGRAATRATASAGTAAPAGRRGPGGASLARITGAFGRGTLTLAAADDDVIEGVAKRIEVEATRQAAMGLEDAHAVELRNRR